MFLIRNVLGMRPIAEVLCAGILADDRVARLADLSSKSCVPDQQILLGCHIRKPPAGRSFLLSFPYHETTWEDRVAVCWGVKMQQRCAAIQFP